ncbi:hypothetical protein APTSU1_001463900 [Apodemus speciosus]|uniref:Uncharacterized protein n=1 Tax=Apodemus speciosus TaxID=105296 RepID=A0ABQ0FJI8_APOSI
MDPLVKRALQGQDEEKLRASMEPSTPQSPPNGCPRGKDVGSPGDLGVTAGSTLP